MTHAPELHLSTGWPSIASKSIASMRRASIPNGLLSAQQLGVRNCNAVAHPRGPELFTLQQGA